MILSTLFKSFAVGFVTFLLCLNVFAGGGCIAKSTSSNEHTSAIDYSDNDDILTLNPATWVLKAQVSPITDIIHSKKFEFTYGEIKTHQAGSYWLKFRLKNSSTKNLLKIELANPQMDTADLYIVRKDYSIDIFPAGNFRGNQFINFNAHQNPTYNISLKRNEVIDCYLYISSRSFIVTPLFVGTTDQISNKQNLQDMLFCIYLGSFLSMIFYNFFIYISTRDRMYLLYVFYTIMIMFSQLTLFGYGYRFIFPKIPEVSYWLYSITGALVGLAAALFIGSFLEIKKHSYALFIAVKTIAYLFLLHFILDVLGFYHLREVVYDFLGLTGCILFYICVITASRKGNASAKYLLAGWSVFFVGHIMFILKNEGLLPYNWITNFGLTAGTAIETILLSFALANRINTLQKDNDKKQQEIIKYLEANEQYLKISKQLAIDAERLKKEILIAEFESLKNQVNPHFLFNSLNVLSDLVYEDPDYAVKFVSELAKVYRYVLEYGKKESINLKLELDFIRSYIFLLKIRFEENIQISIDITEADKFCTAPVSLQLLIENAIKHNIISTDAPLTIKIFREDNYIIIRNNIQLRRECNSSTGVGLKNLVSRYSFLTKNPVEILKTKAFFTVRIPLIYDLTQINNNTLAGYESLNSRR